MIEDAAPVSVRRGYLSRLSVRERRAYGSTSHHEGNTLMSGITSKDISGPTTRPTAPLIPGPIEGSAIVFIGMIISVAFWIIGARWTIDGIIVIYNGFLTFLHVPTLAPMPPSWETYGKLCIIPVAISAVEWFAPFKRTNGVWYFSAFPNWLVWFAVMFFDWYTTYVGLSVDPGTNAPSIMRQIATNALLSGLLSAILTMGPEWLARGMINLFNTVFGIKRK